jgi:hypothetical protein
MARRSCCCRAGRSTVRRLDADERLLWERVTATIRPLSREPLRGLTAIPPPSVVKAPPPPMTPRAKGPPPRPTVKVPQPPRPSNTLDGSWDKKLSKGALEPDRILDLHGHNLDTAWASRQSRVVGSARRSTTGSPIRATLATLRPSAARIRGMVAAAACTSSSGASADGFLTPFAYLGSLEGRDPHGPVGKDA